MAYPTIVFNASTGSDSLSSGAGPATAINGSGASLNGTTTVDLSADSPDLSGVATDGSACLWVQTSSGRQFSQITATDNSAKTVTVNTAYSVTESSRNWAIGGKRATWEDTDSRSVFNDAEEGWIIETETNQTINSAIDFSAEGAFDNFISVKGSNAASLVTIEQTTATLHFVGAPNSSDFWKWQNLSFVNSSGSVAVSVVAIAFRDAYAHLIENCNFGDATNRLYAAININGGGNARFTCVNCTFQYLERGPYGTTSLSVSRTANYINCISKNNSNFGFNIASQSCIVNCIAINNANAGIRIESVAGSIQSTVVNCVIYNNGSDGIFIGANEYGADAILNNVIVGNGGYGINSASAIADNSKIIGANAFYNNTSGNVNQTVDSGSVGANITLTVDPFTDAANGDFTLNTTAGGGAELRSNAFTLGATETRPFRWLDVSTGAGGGVRQVNIRGGADQ